MSKNKRGLSAIVGYVLLISMTLALSVMVYNWLKFYVAEDEIEECPENVQVIINGYECFSRSAGLGATEDRPANLTIQLKNKGLFTVDGYTIRIHDREGAEFGIHVLNNTGKALLPGEEYTETYVFDDSVEPEVVRKLQTVTIVEVQPFMTEDDKVACQSYISQKTICK